MRCPRCDKIENGQVGNGQYYCWHCSLEFHGVPGSWRFYRVDEEGGLIEIADTESSTDGLAPGPEMQTPVAQ